jgi:DNA-binding Lrp family transcriptional regulator
MRKSANTKLAEAADLVFRMRDTMPMWPDISVDFIARELDESPKRVRDCLRELKQNPRARFRTGIDWRKLGFQMYFTYVEPSTFKATESAFKKLCSCPGIVSTYTMGSSRERITAKAWVRPREYNAFLDCLNERLGNDAIGISTERVAKHFLDDSFNKAPEPTKPFDADDTDMQLVRLLRDDGLLTYRELADKVGLSAPSVFERVKRLRDEGVIVGYAPRFIWSPPAGERKTASRLYCWMKVGRNDLDKLGEDLIGIYTKELQVRSAYSLYSNYNFFFSTIIMDYAPLPTLLNRVVEEYDVHTLAIPHLISVKWNQSPNPFPNKR